MIGKIITWAIILIIIFYLIYMISNVVDKMKMVNGDLVREWTELKKLMSYHFSLVVKEIDSENQELVNILNRESKIVKNDDYINVYYDLEKVISTSHFSDELLNELKENTLKIESLRKEYDDDALKMNNYVNSFPTNIIAIFLGYKKWVYFRGK